tara:strand:- start:4300 stop:6153 length:1854 start_codon:yes stop_codon:yes gene_type:complete
MADGTVSKLFGNIGDSESNKEKVSKNVIESEASTFNRSKQTKPNLTSAERRRTSNIAEIISKIFLDNEKKRTKDSSLKTKISKKADSPAAAAQKKVEGPKKKSLGMLATFAIIAAAVTAFAAFIFDNLSPIGQFLMKSIKFLRPVIGRITKVVKGVFKFFTTIGDDLVKFLGKGGGMLGRAGKALGGVGKFLGGLAKGIGSKILKFARFIPVLGSFVSFGFAIAKFRSGDYFGAILELISGVLNLFPTGVTNILSGVIDGFIIARELMGEGEGGGYKMDNKIKEGGSFLGDMMSSIGNFISTKLRNFPIIGGVILMYEGFKELISGNFIEGFKLLGKGLLAWIAGEKGADLIIQGWGFILSLFKDIYNGDAEISFPSFDTIGELIFNIGSIIGGWFTGMIETVQEWFGNVKEWFVDLFTFDFEFPKLEGVFEFFGMIGDFLFSLPGKVVDFVKGAATKAAKFADDTIESIPVVGSVYKAGKSGLRKIGGWLGFGGSEEETVKNTVEDAVETLEEPFVTENKLAEVLRSLTSSTQMLDLITVVRTVRTQLETLTTYTKLTEQNTDNTVKAIKNIKIGNSSVMPLAGNAGQGAANSAESLLNSRADYSLSPYSLNVPST